MGQQEPREIHLPKPSLLPIVMAFSLTLIAIGIVFTWIVAVIGVIGLLATLVAWMLENRVTPEEAEMLENG